MTDFVKVPGWKDSISNTFKVVVHGLRDEEHWKWLLILDNVVDRR